MSKHLKPIEVISRYKDSGYDVRRYLESRAAIHPDSECITLEDQSLSWKELIEEVNKTSALLLEKGVAKGDRVAVMAENSPYYVVSYLALCNISAILVPINPNFKAEEAEYVLNHAEVSGIVHSKSALEVVKQSSKKIKPWLLEIETLPEAVKNLSSQTPSTTPSKDDICLIMYTSGTTGFPKGVMHSQENFILTSEAFVERIHLQPGERVLCILPLYHINALFYSLGGALACGGTLILCSKFSASNFWNYAKEKEATEVNIIASVGNILAKRSREEFNPGHKISKIYGAPISKDIDKVFREEFNVSTLIEGYGMTEIPGATVNPFFEPKIGSMGKPGRHPDHSKNFAELKIVGEDGHEVKTGEQGELYVKTPIVMKGYYKDEAKTKDSFDGEWFKTGDIVKKDDEDYYYFISRNKDIIRRRGENISATEIDNVILTHQSVKLAATIAVPSELGEDDILTAIVLKDGEKLEASEIAAWCKEHLSDHKTPRYIVFKDELPLTPTLRVAKFKLKADTNLIKEATDLSK